MRNKTHPLLLFQSHPTDDARGIRTGDDLYRNRSVIKHTKQHRYQEAPMHLKKYNLID